MRSRPSRTGKPLYNQQHHPAPVEPPTAPAMAGKALMRRLAAAHRHGEVPGDGAAITTRVEEALAVLRRPAAGPQTSPTRTGCLAEASGREATGGPPSEALGAIAVQVPDRQSDSGRTRTRQALGARLGKYLKLLDIVPFVDADSRRRRAVPHSSIPRRG